MSGRILISLLVLCCCACNNQTDEGYPSVMVETASFDWAKEYLAGTSEIFSGHVMSEIYVEGRWILLDNNGAYVFVITILIHTLIAPPATQRLMQRALL